MIADLLLDPGARPIIGHRGASGLAPENTTAAFDLALVHGADALEFDVRLTRDGIPVVCHDPTLDRTTDRAEPLVDLTIGDLDDVDAGYHFSPDGSTHPFRSTGVRIPPLREVLERYRAVPLLIELKVIEAALPVKAELRRAGAEGQAVLASFLDEALVEFRQEPFLAGASRREIARHWVRTSAGMGGTAEATPLCYAVPDRYKGWLAVPTARFIRAAHRAGKPVHVWTVNDPGLARTLWSRGANGMITNFPARLVAARG